jgi:diadenosine tetraphosphate (Ap4A) HIT family hydrolase
MSLLSGIRFVPKESRVSNSDDEKKDKKNKHDKKKHSSHKKHKSDKDKKEKYKRYDSDSSSDVDMNELARVEEEKERQDKRSQSAGQSKIEDDFNNEHDRSTASQPVKGFDPDRFRSLMNSLKKDSASSSSVAPPLTSEGGRGAANAAAAESDSETDPYSQRIASTQNYPPSNSSDQSFVGQNNVTAQKVGGRTTVAAAAAGDGTSTGNTNQSAAALLRERLKQSKLNLSTTAPAASATAANSILNFGTNIGIERDVMALKNRFNELHKDDSKSNSSANLPPQKKRKSNMPGDLDTALDINALKSKEKSGSDDIDEIYRENVLRMGDRYMGTELGGKGAFGNGDKAGMDEEAEVDMRMFQRKDQNHEAALEREARKAMKSQQQLRKAVESCCRCSESKNFNKYTIISAGENAILRMKVDPDVLLEGHLEIIPITHVSSILQCDEETTVEIERFQSCLRRMYETLGKGVLFLESAVHFSSRPHAHIDVIPIERGMEPEASMFFKEVTFALGT